MEKNDFSFVKAFSSVENEKKREALIKNKIKELFEKEVGITDDGSGVFTAMVQFIYECMDQENYITVEFETGDIKDSVNRAVMKILMLDKEKNGVDPDDFTMMCRHISKSLSSKSSEGKSPLLKIGSSDEDEISEEEISKKINLKFL